MYSWGNWCRHCRSDDRQYIAGVSGVGTVEVRVGCTLLGNWCRHSRGDGWLYISRVTGVGTVEEVVGCIFLG